MTRPAIRVTLIGTSPLLMHSGSLLDPLNPVSCDLSVYHNKPHKSAADHAHIGRLEFLGALWLDEGRPCVPARTLEAVLREAAERRGARRIRTALMVESDATLDYDGPPTVEGLVADPDFRLRAAVTVNGRRQITTRPMFRRWKLTSEIGYDCAVLARSDLIDLLMHAGDHVGIGAGRPRYGRFAVAPSS